MQTVLANHQCYLTQQVLLYVCPSGTDTKAASS